MTSEQRYLVYNDMYMSESVSDAIKNIVERIKKFFRDMHDRLTDQKVKKNVDTIKNDSELMNAEVEVPKGMKKVLNELLTKLKNFLKDMIDPDSIKYYTSIALSTAAAVFVTKKFSEKEHMKGSELYRLYNDLDNGIKSVKDTEYDFQVESIRRLRNKQENARVNSEKAHHRGNNLEVISEMLQGLRNIQIIMVAALSAIASGKYIKNKIKK